MLKFAPFYLKKELQELAHKYHFYPKRSSGQNFLVDMDVYKKILIAADLQKTDRVLEIGAGFGSLTVQLAENVEKVWAVELDRCLAAILGKLAPQYPNISVIHQDATKLDISKLTKEKPYKIVANIPYNITSFFLRTVFESAHKPESMVLLVQKEIADRITARPGQLSILGLSTQFFTSPEIVEQVPKKCFWPMPRVDSAIVHFCFRSRDKIQKLLGPNFSSVELFRCIKIGFSSKRKMLKNNLQNGFRLNSERTSSIFHACKLPLSVRAQELSLEQWILLSQKMHFR